jgi:hypothetical protein
MSAVPHPPATPTPGLIRLAVQIIMIAEPEDATPP